MEGFKSTERRLVQLFNNSREKWKKRAAEKQKKMRGMEICQAASLGRRKFYEKLGWLLSHRTDIQTYSEMLTLIGSAQTQIKNQGLHDRSSQRSNGIDKLY
jgi:hypothetical protein